MAKQIPRYALSHAGQGFARNDGEEMLRSFATLRMTCSGGRYVILRRRRRRRIYAVIFEEATAGVLRFAQDDSVDGRGKIARLRGRADVKTYYVYIMTNSSRTLYTGVTGNLERRVLQHKRKLMPGFSREYNINRLVYFETFSGVRDAIQREKQIKGWLRAKKVALIVANNPAWRDLSEGWYGKG